VAFCQLADGCGYLGQRVGLADDRGDLAGFDQPAQRVEVGLAVPGDERGQPLAHQRRERERPELSADPGPLGALADGDNERSGGSECPPEPREAAVPADVEDQVIVLAAVGEVVPGVVDDMAGTTCGAGTSSCRVGGSACGGDPERVRSGDRTRDKDLARHRWEVSEQMTGVRYPFGTVPPCDSRSLSG
jgi:hypothetical protein